MAPRTYTQDKRAEGARQTRERILDVTIGLYSEQGFAATTLKAVAERADVSRGTIIHHFGSADGLLGAVLDEVVERLEIPDERILDGIEDREQRIRTFVESLIRFTQRSAPWWSMFEGEMQRPELQQREAIYWAAIGRFQAAALGEDLATDPEANAAVLGLGHPATVGTLIWSFERYGLSQEDAIAEIVDLAVAAVRRRLARGSDGPVQTRSSRRPH